MAFWVLGLIHQLMNFLAASCLTFGHLAGLTIMTLYWFRRALVAFDEDLQGRIALGGGIVLDVGAAVGHGVAVFFGGDADGGHHALTGVNVPRGVLAGHFHAGDFPQCLFGVVRAGVVAAAHEGDLLFGEGLQGGGDVFALTPAGSAAGPISTKSLYIT